MMRPRMPLLLASFLLSTQVQALDYVEDVLPIMREHCWKCHSNENQVKGSLALDDIDEVRDYQIGKYNIIRPGNPEGSNFLEVLKLDSSHSDFMPRKGESLPERQITVIENWIKLGAVVDSENPAEDEKEWLSDTPTTGVALLQKYVTWTSSDGKAVEARFHSLSGEAVKIVMKDGRSFTIPFSRLDSDSVEQAKKLAGAR
ncbi:MAG: hypothetical protein CMO61_02970 [Verrucomicrobiales bacterium]|jgi:hypothetical protein|nr:hypothetical protein [Verrucomicrobiales bacterium]|tara:strand:- start:11730 stop:12332 length:603 start_codon:yes stop_codon:yes gene_type:complete